MLQINIQRRFHNAVGSKPIYARRSSRPIDAFMEMQPYTLGEDAELSLKLKVAGIVQWVP